MKKRIIWIAAALAVVIAAATLFGRGGKAPAIEYDTKVMAADTITMSVTATGTVNPVNKVDVGTQVSGIISDIYVDFNSEVEQGQLIAQLDRSTLEAEKAVAEESLCAAELDYKLQKRNYERQRNLFEQELISDTEFDDAETAYLKAESSYRQARLSLERAEINLGYTQIYSPISGVVLSRAVDEGQRVEFTVDTYADDTFQGSVRQVRLQSTTTSNVVTYEVVIDAPNPDLKLKPGMTATTTIFTMERGGVFVVPAKALRFVPTDVTAEQRKELPAQHVYVRDAAGALSPREVTTGISNGVETEITSGLSAGDEVVVGPAAVADAENVASVSISL
ncbi:MAG: efflux RND transporter periplasmic adaptor subunit [Alistipes sp.]|nr:efflux RND transporter periplasmic adaptor subunit [Alistipes sp.]